MMLFPLLALLLVGVGAYLGIKNQIKARDEAVKNFNESVQRSTDE